MKDWVNEIQVYNKKCPLIYEDEENQTSIKTTDNIF